MPDELTLMRVDSQAIGYGRLGVKLAEALVAKGLDVRHEIENEHRRTNLACWVSTPGHMEGWWEGQHTALFTMWEAMRLPEAMRENLHKVDTLLVPSPQNVELFGEYHDNVKMVLLGVDPDEWAYVPRTPPTSEFRFLIGGSGSRKGVDLAYKAFRKAFPRGEAPTRDGPAPTLIFKSPKGVDFYGPGIQVVSGRIPAGDEIALYASAHCYLQPSRGEGFGLQPLQAIAQGCPTILTAAHGHESYAHLGWGVSTTAKPAAYFIYGDAGDWWEPDLDELVDQMRWVYNNYEQATARAAVSSVEAHRDFTWERTAEQFIDALGPEMGKPYTGSGAWVKPEWKRYLVILNRDWTADYVGKIHHFVKGVSYYEPADLKRILFEGGLLDPACLEAMQTGENSGMFDLGLTESQVERVGGYSAQHSFCGTCGQPLNEKETKADLLFRAGEKMRVTMAEMGLTAEQIAQVMDLS
jgi:hypothetical protein